MVRGRRDREPGEIAALEAAGVRPVWRFAVDVPGQTTIEELTHVKSVWMKIGDPL